MPLRAADYGVELRIDSEDDLLELLGTGELTDDDYARLLRLLREPIDLDTADRDTLYQLPALTWVQVDGILAWRQAHGRLEAVDDLEAIPGLDADIVAQLRPFVRVPPPRRPRARVHTSIEARAVYTWDRLVMLEAGDAGATTPSEEEPDGSDSTSAEEFGGGATVTEVTPVVPASFLEVHTGVAERIDLGIAVIEQAGIASYDYSAANRSFTAEWSAPVVTPVRMYASVRDRWGGAIVGSYTAGFGERLTFDDTGRARPAGWYRDDTVWTSSTGFRAPDHLFGVALTWAPGPGSSPSRSGPASIRVTVFGSWVRPDLFQYDFVLPPTAEWGDDAYGRTPEVLIQGQTVSAVTLPHLYTERLLGGHLDLALGSSLRLGVTGYLARIDRPLELYFTSPIPNRPWFGALGVDFGARAGAWDFAAEAAVMDNGGVAAFVRSVWTSPRGELACSLRHYGTDYDNPHSHGYASPDTYRAWHPDSRSSEADPPFDPALLAGGDRDRDEQGGAVQGRVRLRPWLTVRGKVDAWRHPSLDVWDLETTFRLGLPLTRRVAFDLWAAWLDRDLERSGHSLSYTSARTCDTELDPACAGELEAELDPARADEPAGARLQLAGQVVTTPMRRLELSLLVKETLEDAARLEVRPDCTAVYGFRQGASAWLRARYLLSEGAALTTRIHYQDDDLEGSSGARIAEGSLQIDQRVRRWLRLSVRYAVGSSLPDPADPDLDACDAVESAGRVSTAALEPLDSSDEGAGMRVQQRVKVGLEARF